jgi:hypothetical protein
MAVVLLQLRGIDEQVADLDAISYRMRNAAPAFRDVIPTMERAEMRLFARLRGRYVDTGRLLASLTTSVSPNAIRDVGDDELIFGTSVYYARFLRAGKYGKRRGRKSAVLNLLPRERKQVAATILDYILDR